MAVVLLARLLLAAVFTLAGLAKLADRAGSRRALVGFGIPARLASPLGVVLPLVEVSVAGALVVPASAEVGAVGALVLLFLFIAAVGINLALGRKPDCHCFGQVHATPIGGQTLVRNVVLAGVAGLVLWQGGRRDPSVVSWLSSLGPGEIVGIVAALLLLAVVAVQGWLTQNLLRQNGRILLRLDRIEEALERGGLLTTDAPPGGLPVGSVAPAFELLDLEGGPVSLSSLRSAGKPVTLVSSDPDCGPCTALLPEIGEWQRRYGDQLTIVVLSRKGIEDNRPFAAEYGLSHVLLQHDGEVAEAYRMVGTPRAVVVLPDGTVGSHVAGGAEEIRGLVGQVVEDRLPVPVTTGSEPLEPLVPPRKVGEPAPPVSLADLEGRTVDLADFRGRQSVVLFWSPHCGFCQRMLPELKAWERRHGRRAPDLLVVSTGTVEENRPMGLRSPVVLDDRFGVGRSFGADGTPSALLVDEEGRVASEVMVGAAAVLRLCRKGGNHAKRQHDRTPDKIRSGA
jgi:peroxiredoxin/uncharacterized membrane protein YphA (DoxX/SURF4 family)